MKALCTASKSLARAAGGARRVSSSEEISRPEWAASRPACARRVAVAIEFPAAVGEHAVYAHLAQGANHGGGDLDAQHVLRLGAVEGPFGRVAHAVAGHHVYVHDVLIAGERVALRHRVEAGPVVLRRRWRAW